MAVLKNKRIKGFTLYELIAAMVTATIIIGSAGFVLVEGHKDFARFFSRVNSDVVVEAYCARLTFDSIVRKSTIKRFDLLNQNQLFVYYYSNPQDFTISDPDRYARFYADPTAATLLVDHGTILAGTWDSMDITSLSPNTTSVLAENVEFLEFETFSGGAGLRMLLTLNNNKETITVTVSAMRHCK